MSSCPDGSPILLIGQLHPPTVAIRSRPCWGCRRSHAALGMPRLAGSGKRSVPVGALGRSDQFGGGRGVETERVASKLVQCRLVDSNALQCNVLLVPWRQGLSRTQIRTFEGGEGARQAPRGKKNGLGCRALRARPRPSLIPCCHSQDPTPALTTDSGAVDVNTLPGSRDHSVATASGLTRPCFQDAAVAP